MDREATWHTARTTISVFLRRSPPPTVKKYPRLLLPVSGELLDGARRRAYSNSEDRTDAPVTRTSSRRTANTSVRRFAEYSEMGKKRSKFFSSASFEQ